MSDFLLRPYLDERDPAVIAVLRGVQGHILESHRRKFVWHFLLRFGPAAPDVLRRSLASLPITDVVALRLDSAAKAAMTGGGERILPGTVYAVGLASGGYRKLRLALTRFHPEFRQGLRSRAREVTGTSPEEWEAPGWGPPDFDAVVICASDHEAELVDVGSQLHERFQGIAAVRVEKTVVIRRQFGTRWRAIEHFGFADGVSQPTFFEDPAAFRFQSRFRPSAMPAIALRPEPFPGGGSEAREYGSYMAMLKIEQHIERFKQAMAAAAGTLCPHAANLEATQSLIVGRHADGRPLAPTPGDPNDFDSSVPPELWPYSSHTRKMNQRGEPGAARIVRRGVPYEDGASKGLLFACFQAKLSAQFEVLMKEWANEPSHPVEYSGSDPIIGRPSPVPQRFPGCEGSPVPLSISGLTSIRGGAYFYFPAIPFFRALPGMPFSR